MIETTTITGKSILSAQLAEILYNSMLLLILACIAKWLEVKFEEINSTHKEAAANKKKIISLWRFKNDVRMIYIEYCIKNVCDSSRIICCQVADSHIIYEFLRPLPPFILHKPFYRFKSCNDARRLPIFPLFFHFLDSVIESELKNNYP